MLASPAIVLPLRISEHQRKDFTMGQHLVECCGTAYENEWKMLDACRSEDTVMSTEAIYIKQQLSTPDEYCGRELSSSH